MGLLFAVTQEFDVLVIDWERLVQDWTRKGFLTPLQQILMSDNKRLSRSARGYSTDEPQLVDLGEIPADFVLARFDLNLTSFADWAIYNRTIYLSDSQAVWEIPVFINGSFERFGAPTTIVQAPALQLKVKYGVLSAACGVAGLAARPVFHWNQQDFPSIAPVDVVDAPAMRTSWLGSNALAIAEDRLSILGTHFAEGSQTSSDRELERKFVDVFASTRRLDTTRGMNDIHFGSGFGTSALFYALSEGALTILKLGAEPDAEWAITGRRDLDAQIFDGFSSTTGIALDTDVGTYAGGPRASALKLISREPNLTVRAFNQSMRYKRQLWSVKEQRIEIDAVYV